ncbi:MAG TPA: bifunctional hydroxymethylpyrimidine kinase/phosphomethylpyrimidine kinase [Pseudobacteroides sp.]|nr:bifunctional hydroxymethylpyrimidine kinase/phosphomethylpyrimidine kinase [Pseudobacteroides sp.]
MKTVLTIAGSDSSGGAGIQADIKTMTANGVYAISAVTALTAQNTTGVTGIVEVTPEFLSKQLDSVFTDIYPDAVKIGMVTSAQLIETISKMLKFYNARNIVVDPVMISTSGSKFLEDDALETMKNSLFPQAVLLTPNIPEASVLSGITIVNEADMIKATEIIGNQFGCAVLCKGGHRVNDANDLLYYNNKYKWFVGEKINNENTHGTGCTLSSAIACGLAKGMDLETSIQMAKDYISGALKAMLDLGKGNGPLNHMWNIHRSEN